VIAKIEERGVGMAGAQPAKVHARQWGQGYNYTTSGESLVQANDTEVHITVT